MQGAEPGSEVQRIERLHVPDKKLYARRLFLLCQPGKGPLGKFFTARRICRCRNPGPFLAA